LERVGNQTTGLTHKGKFFCVLDLNPVVARHGCSASSVTLHSSNGNHATVCPPVRLKFGRPLHIIRANQATLDYGHRANVGQRSCSRTPEPSGTTSVLPLEPGETKRPNRGLGAWHASVAQVS